MVDGVAQRRVLPRTVKPYVPSPASLPTPQKINSEVLKERGPALVPDSMGFLI